MHNTLQPARSSKVSRWLSASLLAACAVTTGCGATVSDETTTAAASDESALPTLFSVVQRLGSECARFSPGTTCGIAVRLLDTGATATANGYRQFVSASSAKLIWVTAAMRSGAPVTETTAQLVFLDSDNAASAQVLLALGGGDGTTAANRVNDFYWNTAGMSRGSHFCHWNGPWGTIQVCSGDNLFTPLDAVNFLTKLWAGSLAGAQTGTVLRWASLTGRHNPPLDNWLTSQLPGSATVYHKAGWIPGSGYNDGHEIGIVRAATGKAYAVAILMDGNPSSYYGKQIPFGSYASCVIYHRVNQDAADPFAVCNHP